MEKSNQVRALVAITLVIVSFAMLVPTYVGIGEKGNSQTLPEWYTKIFSKKMVLGLDLQGGIHLQYKVDVEEALRRKATQTAGNIEGNLLKERKVTVKAIPMTGENIDEITTIDIEFAKRTT